MLYVGIDIGDGETAVAMLDDYAVGPVTLPLGYPRHSILSAVGELHVPQMNKDGVCENKVQYVIGDNVIQATRMENRSVRFKSRFLTDDASHEDLEHFAQGLQQALIQHNPAYAEAKDLRVIVGCPTGAGWTDEVRRRYAEVIGRVLPLHDLPVGESRAAFLYTKYSVHVNVDPALLSGNVLVIDMGSSTTDLAYIVDGREKQLGVFGAEHLGGGLIDRALLDACVRQGNAARQVQAFLAKTPSVRARCEIRAREMKEKYFTAQARGQADFSCRTYETLYYGINRTDVTSLSIEANDELINQVLTEPMPELDGATFTAALHQLLKKAQSVTREAPPKLVILTGGASRMRFFQEAVGRMFPDAVVSCCQQPEFSIAEGLAFACRVDKRMERFMREITLYLASDRFTEALADHLPQLINRLSSKLAPLFLDLTLNLPENIRRGVKAHDPDAIAQAQDSFYANAKVQSAFRSTVNEWIAYSMDDISFAVGGICTKYGITTPLSLKVDAGSIRTELPPMAVNMVLSLIIRFVPLLGPMLRSLLTGLLRQRTVASLRKEMARPDGPFFTDVSTTIADALRKEIEAQARTVQIPIL